ncbi:MAG: hypothetical protein V2A61_02655 [Calditrichota bacterium]
MTSLNIPSNETFIRALALGAEPGDKGIFYSTAENGSIWRRWAIPVGVTVGAGALVYFIYRARGR